MKKTILLLLAASAFALAGCKPEGGTSDQYNTTSGSSSSTATNSTTASPSTSTPSTPSTAAGANTNTTSPSGGPGQ